MTINNGKNYLGIGSHIIKIDADQFMSALFSLR